MSHWINLHMLSVLLSSNMFSGALPQDEMAKCWPTDNISDANIAMREVDCIYYCKNSDTCPEKCSYLATHLHLVVFIIVTFKAFQKPINILLFSQVSSLHLLQVFIISPSSIMLEDNMLQIWSSSRTARWWSGHLITKQALTELIMEEIQLSCSCSKETMFMWACPQITMFGQLKTAHPSVVSCSVRIRENQWLQKDDSNNLRSMTHRLS